MELSDAVLLGSPRAWGNAIAGTGKRTMLSMRRCRARDGSGKA